MPSSTELPCQDPSVCAKVSVSSSFLMFLLCNLCFYIFQLVYMYSQENSFVAAIKLPWAVYKELLATFGVHSGLYLLLSWFQTFLFRGIVTGKRLCFSVQQWQIIIWSLCLCAILSANAYYFPLSIFSKLLSPLLSTQYTKMLLILSLGLLALLLIQSLMHYKRFSLIFLVFILALFITSQVFHQRQEGIGQQSQANIILLGIDSLSLTNVKPSLMPFLYQHLQNSTQFTNTISPLARTFPAWCTILTGLYAKHHHADENLVAKHSVKRKASIVWTLNQLGYYTVFASDDRRFNSMDKSFGFQQIIGPKLGVNDVLLGSFNDFPLSNLLLNLPMSGWLFPYNYINRASFFSYYPESFNRKLKAELLDIKQKKKPIFLAVHLTLPHWPYAWAVSSPALVADEFSQENRDVLYKAALSKVDQQFEALFRFLKQEHFLDTSLVLTLSDHGEAIYDRHSRMTTFKNYQGKFPSALNNYFKNKTATPLDKSAGHGSDLLSPDQYHSILAFHHYVDGRLKSLGAKISSRSALIDIAPTLMAFIQPGYKTKMDGISLVPSILNPKAAQASRSFFIESGMFPNQYISKQKAMRIAKYLFKINAESGELELKANELKKINQQKLYGIIKGHWILALYPNGNQYIGVVQNLKTGQWIDDLNSDFAQSSPASMLQQELCQFYGKKLSASFCDPV